MVRQNLSRANPARDGIFYIMHGPAGNCEPEGPITIEAVRAVVPWRRGEEGFEIPEAVHRLEEL